MLGKTAVFGGDTHRCVLLQESVSSGAGGAVALWEIRNVAMLMREIPAQPGVSFLARAPK